MNGGGLRFDALVDTVESTGADLYAHARIEGGPADSGRIDELATDASPSRARDGTPRLVARLDPTTGARPGTRLTLRADPRASTSSTPQAAGRWPACARHRRTPDRGAIGSLRSDDLQAQLPRGLSHPVVVCDDLREPVAERLSGSQVDGVEASQGGAAVKRCRLVEQCVVEPQERDSGQERLRPVDRRPAVGSNRADDLHAGERA